MSNTSCTRTGCQIVSTGKCLEGFEPPNTCPYVLSSVAPGSAAESSEQKAFIDLPSGEALTESQATDVTREGVTQVIVLAGPLDSGKTTILTSLYEAFLEAPFGNFRFAGSCTLVGFERRCHDARIISERKIPHTARTPVSDVVEFLHLRLAPASPSLLGPQNLLLSDISGERFRSLRDSVDAVKNMKMLRRTDHFCIVLDGDKLADPSQRHAVRNDARMLLRSIVEANALSPKCKIEVIFSKWDLVVARSDQESLMSFISETKSALESTATSFAKIQFYEVAARPENTKLPFAHGLPTLLRSWLEEPIIPERAKLYMPLVKDHQREISRFATSIAKTQRLGDHYNVFWV